jgi:hydrogenase maturation protein HypF
VIRDRLDARDIHEIARAFHHGIAQGLINALQSLTTARDIDTVVLSGGVFQNELLLEDLKAGFATGPLSLWTNCAVPPNDGGISLGQAAIAALSRKDQPRA